MLKLKKRKKKNTHTGTCSGRYGTRITLAPTRTVVSFAFMMDQYERVVLFLDIWLPLLVSDLIHFHSGALSQYWQVSLAQNPSKSFIFASISVKKGKKNRGVYVYDHSIF